MRMRKTAIIRVLLTALLLLTFSMSRAQNTQPIFRVGVLDDMNGPISNGARLAVRQINASGGVRGADGTSFLLELVIRPIASPDAINTLGQFNLIALLGPETTEDVLANLSSLQALNIPILTPALGDTILISDASGMFSRTRAAERLHGQALADVMFNTLNIQYIGTAQLDNSAAGGYAGFSMALEQIVPRPQEKTYRLGGGVTMNALVSEIVADEQAIVVAFGQPALVAQFYTQLRTVGWAGLFVYNQVDNPAFRDNIPEDKAQGILGTSSWPLSSTDETSTEFMSSYAHMYGAVPGSIAAASYDAVFFLAEAIGQPGSLSANLAGIRDLPGVQGTLNPGVSARGELSNSVSVIQLNEFGGADIIARYADGMRLTQGTMAALPSATPLPVATATPVGVVLTIESNFQNVRSGPSTQYDVLGRLERGTQAQIVGATVDYSWVVIQYRGQNGWLAAYLLDIWGDLSTLPVVAIPPTPTPGPPTATPLPPAIPDIVITSAVPSSMTQGVLTSVNVTVANIGGADAGGFAIAASFPPDNAYASANVAGLPMGAQQIVILPVTLSGSTGNYSVTIVADLNNEVNEGDSGEANNHNFSFSYKVDKQLILINNTSLAAGASVDLEGNVGPINDIQYTGAGLNTINVCTVNTDCIGLLSPGLNWDTSYYDAISSGNGINATFIANAALTPGTILGVLTAEGRRAVVRVDAISPGISITLTYRVYQ